MSWVAVFFYLLYLGDCSEKSFNDRHQAEVNF
jgi:hypothetical protein